MIENKTNTKLATFFANNGQEIAFKKGQVIILPGDTPSGVFYIQKGYVKIYSISEDGDEKLHIIYKPNEIFPLMWTTKNILKSVFYEAMNNVLVRRVTKESFLDFVSRDKNTLLELIDQLVILLSIFVDRIENLEIMQSYPRLVASLLFLADRFGEKENGEIIIQAPITHKDIANSIAMSRETASREMAILEKKGLVRYKNHLIVITDQKKLEKELTMRRERRLL